jgi:hypothetical protein
MLSDHKTVTIFVKCFHSKSMLCPIPQLHCNQNALKLAANGDSGICPSVAGPEKTVLQNHLIH